MSDEPSSVVLFARWQAGDEHAAEQIFQRYVQQLSSLAQQRLSARMQRRVSPEDVVQSVYRCFFRAASEGRYSCEHSGDLWRLLATITINKVLSEIRYHTAGKRAINEEASSIHSAEGSSVWRPEALAREPTPEEAAILVEELEHVLRDLEPTQREIVQLRLQGHDVQQIAEQTQRSERTVRRVLERVQADMEQRVLATTPEA